MPHSDASASSAPEEGTLDRDLGQWGERGTVSEKLDWAWERLEHPVPENQVFGQDGMINVMG